MNTLELFNSVVERETKETKPFISTDGYVITPGALWAKDKIIDYYRREMLDGNDLNKTFHKSWFVIKESTREELAIHQVLHYISTYGSNFQDEIYIPTEVLNVPDVKLKFKVINALTKEEMTNKCLGLLQSGIALNEETVDKLISVLVDELDYTFTGNEGIRNKEAIVKIADLYHVYPQDPTEFLRYIVYRTTGSTLLIKSEDLINEIKNSRFNPTIQMKKYGLVKLAEIFNRFKPLFLAYKDRSPKVVNKISKLSKKYHKPLISNPLNEVTQRKLNGEDVKRLDKATPYALFKALSACYLRKEGQDTFVYRIRNGKSWVKEKEIREEINIHNHRFLLEYMKDKFSLEGKKVFLPKDIEYALPTSEKMYVGNIPTGTSFSGKKLAVGIYWKNEWGARDLDLSGMNIGGKIGWNSDYNQDSGRLMFSGDITNAPNGAVEYLYANNGLEEPTLVMNNIYNGKENSGYKIIVGKGDKINKSYMMDPNKLFVDIKTETVQKQTILGIFIPEKNKQKFVVLNFGAGHTNVSGHSEKSNLSTKALYQQWNNPLTLSTILKELNVEIVEDPKEADFDFSLDNIEKDSFIKLFQ